MKKIPLVLYAGDSEQEGTQCGDETIRRMNTAVDFIQKNKIRCSSIILGAGIRPRKRHYPQLKQVMKEFLQTRLPHFPVRLTEKDGWGTFKESLAIYEELKRYDEDEVYLCSSWYHIPRILFIWRIISKGSIKIHTVPARSFRLRSALKELFAFGKVFIDWLKWKHPSTLRDSC